MTGTGTHDTAAHRPDPSPRDTALHDLLVRAVETTPRPRRRRWRAATIGGAVVCTLVGGVVGGTITAAATPDPEAVAAQAGARTAVQGATLEYMRIVGTPRATLGSGDRTVAIGTPPRGADQFVWSFRCRSDTGVTSVGPVRTDATTAAAEPGTALSDACTDGATVNGAVSVDEVTGRTLAVRTSRDGDWTLSTGWVASPPMPEPSAAQRAALTDGVVTRSEYLAAFQRFQGCMTARGQSLGVVPDSSLFVAYGVPDVFVGDACGRAEFDQVSAAWETEHPAPDGADPATWGAQPYDAAADPEHAG